MDHTHEIRRHVTRRTVSPSNFRHATSFSMPSWDTQKVLKNYPVESWGTQKRTQKSFKPTLFVPFRRTQKFHHNKARAVLRSPFLKTVFAPESGTMRTFDKKNLGKTPPPFPHTPQKNLGRRVCVDCVEYIFCGASREFFFF